ncbi:c-type cytochrome [Pelomonas sp. CA6]|uniref:c-type cytochrome n=1 Tax=Pelomonas sp. CA6 TaxID=2907999 RepID=UPI001F4C212F|nr:c-type cytochrome [Pelomonas sp. CA6]MCH7344585.1 c-type cytochrome [Pelomonas sp. CA6]
MRAIPAFALGGALLLAGCGAREPAPPPALARIEQARPADARLAQAYERSCLACHTRPESGAPLTGHAAAWAPRLAKGMPALQRSVAQGLGGMPAQGLCPDCTPADVEQLILFMSHAL